MGLIGKIAVVTGGSSGIGRAIAKELVTRGATVTFLSRSRQRAQGTFDEILKTGPPGAVNRLHHIEMDLEDLPSVHKAAAKIKADFENRCDMLILNAGILYPSDPSFTQYDPANGLCRAFKTNYLGHFVLQKELEHALLHTGRILAIEAKQRAQTARIVTVGSDAHRLATRDSFAEIFDETKSDDNDPVERAQRNYSITKAYLNLLTFALQERYNLMAPGALPPILANAFDPGRVSSKIFEGTGPKWFVPLANLFSQTPEKAAETAVFLATSPRLDVGIQGHGGFYWQGKDKEEPSPLSRDRDMARRLWALSEQLAAQEPIIRSHVRSAVEIALDRS